MLPRVGPRLERRVLGGRMQGKREERRVRGVAERSYHARHVLERRLLHPPLGQWTRRLPLEIKDDEILLGAEHLSQMVVAVNPRANPGAIDAANSIELVEQHGAGTEHSFRL